MTFNTVCEFEEECLFQETLTTLILMYSFKKVCVRMCIHAHTHMRKLIAVKPKVGRGNCSYSGFNSFFKKIKITVQHKVVTFVIVPLSLSFAFILVFLFFKDLNLPHSLLASNPLRIAWPQK